MKFITKIILTVLILGVTLGAKNVATITGLNGQAFIERAGSKIELNTGDKLQEKDTVITDAKAKVQIIFEDETVVTVGKNSIFSIDEYLFEENQAPVAKFGMLKGAMRTITGSIGRIAPDKFSVVTKTTTIGIRGTNFSVIIGEDNSHNIYCTYGAISVEFDGDIYLVRQGFYIAISADGKVEIREFKPQDIKDMKEKSFGKSVAKEGQANNEGLIDNIKEYDSEIVIKEVEVLIEDAKHHTFENDILTQNNVIAGYTMHNAIYEGSYLTTSNTTGGFEDSGRASLNVDFSADSASLTLYGGAHTAVFDHNPSGFNTNSFALEVVPPSQTGDPVGSTNGAFYGRTGENVKGTFNYQPGGFSTDEAVGTYKLDAMQTLY